MQLMNYLADLSDQPDFVNSLHRLTCAGVEGFRSFFVFGNFSTAQLFQNVLLQTRYDLMTGTAVTPSSARQFRSAELVS